MKGVNMTTAEKLEKFIRYANGNGFFNGAWLLAENGVVTSEGALGVADLSGRELTTDSVFEMASVSKQFTASAVMLLKEKGLLKLDDPLAKYFPKSPYDPAITLRHLLHHTSGLPDYMQWVGQKAMTDGVIYPTDILEDFLYESGEPALFSPGDRWEYCNTGYALLALIIEKVSGKTYADFLHDEIFGPAGMDRTTIYHRRLNKDRRIENYAYGMVWENGSFKYPDDTVSKSYVVPLDGIEGDGTVNSTLHDMFMWDRALRNGTVLSHAAQEEMRVPARLNDGSVYPYGFGWSLDLDRADGLAHIRHNGTWPGYRTMFVRFLDSESTFIYMLNREGLDSIGDAMTKEGLLGTVLGQDAMLPGKAENIGNEISEAEFLRISGTYEGNGSAATIRRGSDGKTEACLGIGGQNYTVKIVSVGRNIYYTDPLGIRFECDGNIIHNESIGKLLKI